nr:hypothetical protein [Rhizobium sp. SG570]
MRTPQRSFVVEVKSGRRQSKTRVSSIWGDTDLKALAREVHDKPSHPFSSNDLSRTPDAGEDKLPDPSNAGSVGEDADDLDVAQTLIPSAVATEFDAPKQQADRPNVEAVAQMQESEPAPQPQAASARAARKRTRHGSTHANAQASTGAHEKQSARSATFEDPISLDEVTALEAENKRLKRLLAEQLRAENLRLNKMLERFDVT